MFKNLTIRKKLIMQTVVPILIIVALVILNLNFTYSNVKELRDVKDVSIILEKISLLIHETQKERGMTAGFLGSGGKKFKDRIPGQRALTDDRLKEFQKTLQIIDVKSINMSIADSINHALEDISRIQEIRSRVDTLSIGGPKAIAYYTNMNAKFLNIVVKISSFSTFPQATKQIIAYLNFLLAKERAGIERAVGTNITANDYFKPGYREKFTALVIAQNTYMANFKEYASKEAIDFYTSTLNDRSVQEVERMRDIILKTKGIGGFGVDGTYWFKTITKKLGLLKKTEDFITEHLRITNLKNKTHVKVAIALSNFIHETQKERGATAGFIGSKGKKFGDILAKQRLNTNKKIKLFKQQLFSTGTTFTVSQEAKRYLNKGLAQ